MGKDGGGKSKGAGRVGQQDQRKELRTLGSLGCVKDFVGGGAPGGYGALWGMMFCQFPWPGVQHRHYHCAQKSDCWSPKMTYKNKISGIDYCRRLQLHKGILGAIGDFFSGCIV